MKIRGDGFSPAWMTMTAAAVIISATAPMSSAFSISSFGTNRDSSPAFSSPSITSPQKWKGMPHGSALGVSLTSISNDAGTSFESMSRLIDRLDKIESSAPSTLFGFYEPHLTSFSLQPGSTGSRLSVTSTCYALLAMHSAENDGELYQAALISSIEIDETESKYDDFPDAPAQPVRFILKKLLTSEWRDGDLFQVPLLLYTWLVFDPRRTMLANDEKIKENVQKLVSIVLAARPKRRHGIQNTVSEYIAHLLSSVYVLLQDGEYERRIGPSEDSLPSLFSSESDTAELAIALLRSAEISYMEVCRQLAARAANDSGSFDVIRMAYALKSYIKTTNSLSSTTSPEGVSEIPTRLNTRIVDAALAVIFKEQNEDGLWDQGQPIYKSFRRQGRDIGNAFVFAVDTVSSLLSVLPAESFRPYMSSLSKTLDWIETRQTVAVIPDYCDPNTGQCYGKPLRGWTSPYLSDGETSGPYAWSTAQVFACVSKMRTTVKELLHDDVLAEFNGVPLSKIGPDPKGWDRLLDSDLGDPDSPDYATLKSVLEKRIIVPFQDSVSNPSFGAAYSSILFGPPGTAKSTVCESLAARLGWDFVVIDTSAFLADGLTNVASRIRYVFKRLMALDSAVILFDEVEEFMLNRETPGLAMESRMLTTAMLTAINDLRRTERSVFFVATNRLRAFDAAITRPGRFDMQLFVGTPNLDARVELFRQALQSGKQLDEAEQESALTVYREFLSSVWSEDARFMNYLEGKQYAAGAATLAAAGSLSQEALANLLEKQASVMTVRGTVREDFLASMSMSRM